MLLRAPAGLVGGQLTARLGEAGHQVVAFARHPGSESDSEGVEERAVDVSHVEEVREALEGAQAAYYLIHSMGSGAEFVRKDLELARKFSEAAASAGVERIIYQGALGSGELSPHLASRQQVGAALGSAGVPVVELRAAVILGSGSISFELLRYLTERLPIMTTPLDQNVTHSLMESMTSAVVVLDAGKTSDAFGIRPLTVDAAMHRALDDQEENIPKTLFDGSESLNENVYQVYLEEEVEPEAAAAIRRDLAEIGGNLAWYGWPWAWRVRFVIGLIFGERNPLGRPKSLAVGESADWWTIAQTSEDTLVLRSHAWATGEGWLGYSIPPGGSRLQVAAAFRPRGLPGFLYWFLMTPIHKVVFKAMAKVRIVRAKLPDSSNSAATSGLAARSKETSR